MAHELHVAHTSAAQPTRVACKNNIRVVYVHNRLTLNGILRHC